ncbi:MAG: low temperature requirement protein A [bacterium]|nr:low temperature requirement protein A [Alphaproteobacteria bacterium]MDI1363574.1 low temperature requirement protein A [bacterium]
MDSPEDLTDEELLDMLTPYQLAELNRTIGETFADGGVDRVEALFALAQVYTMRAAQRDETSALALLQLAAAMRRRADQMAGGMN